MSKRARKPRVQNNVRTAGKRPGGVTGKGFLPGTSGNPGGRPKKTPFTDACRTVAEMRVTDLRVCRTDQVPIAIAKKLARQAIGGRVRAAAELANRVEGTPTQRHEIGGPDGTAARVEANLSIDNLFGAIRVIYGLDPDAK
jgi:hypothetical protein